MEYLIITILLSLSALFSGLTLALLSLDIHELKRKMSLGNREARAVYSIRKSGNLLLVTLTVGNVAANSMLAVFLGSIAPGVVAVLVATGLITIFGQILPQAVFSRFALTFGAKTAWITRFFIVVFFPVSWPLAWILDKILGEEIPNIYSKEELVKILEEHAQSQQSDVIEDEERIARGALTFGAKKIAEVMTPRSMITALGKDERVDVSLVKKVRNSGYSRIPVYGRDINDIVGMLYLHDLVNPKSVGKTVGQICESKAYFVNKDRNLDHVLNAFLKTKHHLFVVINEFAEVEGLISIEDVLEEILGKEIIDEFDKYSDARAVAKRKNRRLRRTV